MTDGADSLRWDPGAERMVALSRNAHRGVDLRDDIDYWYRLGQRNAYAHAAGIVVAHGLDSNAFAVSERITAALSDGVSDVAELRAAALDLQDRSIDPEVEVTWIGPLQFHQQYTDLAGIDQDYGMRWGSNGDQRVSLRRPVGADRGRLYVYNPTWDEYGVLFRDVSVAAVEAFSRAVQRGSVTLGGRRVGVDRPRMRATDGGEVPVAAYELFSGSEILGRMAMGRMLGGLSSRRSQESDPTTHA